MDKKRLIEIAYHMVENGKKGSIDKCIQFLKSIRENYTDQEEMKEEFLKMIAVAYKKPDILCGGKDVKENFREFVKKGMKIDLKGIDGRFKDKDFRDMSIDELIYTLGTAKRMVLYNEKYENKRKSSKESRVYGDQKLRNSAFDKLNDHKF